MKLVCFIKIVAITSLTFTLSAHAAEHKTPNGNATVLETLVVLDQNEVLIGIEASNKTISPDVNDFVKMMINDHGKHLVEALTLGHKLNLPTDNFNTAIDLRMKGAKEINMLAALDSSEFEKAYIETMVKNHENTLILIDKKLLKSASDIEVKTFLEEARKTVESHLEEAKKIQNLLVNREITTENHL